ncbi:alpha/beta fold hydrolase [Streptomyces sp. NPDC047976]|uniref:alpha/beta fold hydrolase n=1 Tax=Streptomyces sp. NPDC047976 TaxID=3155746 RepID=UPI003429D16A
MTPVDHKVKHQSTVPANYGEEIELFVRQYKGGSNARPVLMLHGRSTPALAGLDLVLQEGNPPQPNTKYSWAQFLAGKGFDVFVMDLQGSGRSHRPKMDDPCNANPTQRDLLNPNPGTGTCSPTANYPNQLGNAKSDWDELGTVVTFIRGLCNNQKVAFIGWSAASLAMAPYALQNPTHVSSLFLLGPVFPPNGPWSTKPSAPFDPPPGTSLPLQPVSKPAAVFGFPMNLTSKDSFTAVISDANLAEQVWQNVMASDDEGRKWGGTVPGAPEGVMRWRNTYWWGWNDHTVGHGSTLGNAVPVCIVYGDQDTTANTPEALGQLHISVPKLYAKIPGKDKLMFRVEGWDHYPVWERKPAQVLQHMSWKWLDGKKVYGVERGSWLMDPNNVLTEVV